MTRWHVIRRSVNRGLAVRHAANSCDFCRRVLPAGYLLELTAEGSRKFCGLDCRDDCDAARALEAESLETKKRMAKADLHTDGAVR